MDTIKCQILQDGTISVQTSDISDTNHLSADEVLDLLSEYTGTARQDQPLEHEFWKTRDVRRIKGKTKIVQR